jgi:hypothetical protein
VLKGHRIAFSEASNPRSSSLLRKGFNFQSTAHLKYKEYQNGDVYPFAEMGEGEYELLVKYYD